MQLVFIRHGQPVHEHNPGGIADPGLSDLGRWQADRLRAWLSHEPIDAIVCSSKRRAWETIEPLATELSIPIEVVPDLEEIDRYSPTYFPTEVLMTNGGEYWEAIKRQAWDEVGWDTPEVFAARVSAAVTELVDNPRGAHVAVACHGGTIRYAMRSLMPGAPLFRAGCDYASITRLEVIPGKEPGIVSLNETGHFDGDRASVRGTFDDGETPGLRY